MIRYITNGAPDVTGLRHDSILTVDDQPYLERYHLIETDGLAVRYHHWRNSDDARAPHDHPWDNVSVVLAGQLREHDDSGTRELEPGAVTTRLAETPHRIELLTDDAWTLFITHPIRRRWGFHTANGWVHWKDWPYAGRYVGRQPRPGHPARRPRR